ncbi:MAG: arsenate reductase ArsC [Pseudomonadales bacterium]|nr:arsenate reductase ArsC [Pseudomonadales bacterium]MDP6470712.1 arsenate reductase ArsC [Pseudomonadales bacterium]MDP6828336.1 arsenate reductase ArsC [Pseudomonadales bacterium]MDP6972114.1 arsenate reductase ArsC [Pseudomonadales bacterium]
MNKRNVLFLCTGNSARSILAEALLTHLGGRECRAFSAGNHPTGEISPQALEELRIRDFPTSRWRSKSWDEFLGDDAPSFSHIITLCGNAEQACPVFPGAAERLHWGQADPATGEASIGDTFDALECLIHDLLANFRET